MAVVAIVFSSAVPIEPPSCWPVLSVADATPASEDRTPQVPAFIADGTVSPRPRP
jgi:hypothetical protein